MQFSLKWLLAGTLYVAIAAAAFAKPHWASAAAVWLITLFAVVYALIVATSASGSRQVAAKGFAIASVLLFLGLHFTPEFFPIEYVVDAIYPAHGVPVILDGSIDISLVPPPAMAVYPGDPNDPVYRNRVATAVAVMLAGIVGATLGVMAYRRGREMER